MKLKRFLRIFGAIAILLTLVPLIAVGFWWIRIFDFLHVQLTLLTLTAIIVYYIKFDFKDKDDYFFMAVMICCFVFQFTKIYAYLPHNNYEIGNATNIMDKDRHIFIYMANVLQDNTDSQALIKEIRSKDPDVLVLSETNTRWKNDISAAVSRYPYKIEIPLDNTYGMLVYSHLELIDSEIKFLVDDSIPSIHTKIVLKSGDVINFHSIHPTPPMPQHNPSSTERDAEMMLVAKKANNSEIPSIIAGDFNDVAWSGTTTLFKNVSGLMDVRIGRGLLSSYNANSYFKKWALDHVFASEEFRVVKFELGKDINSDHLPLEITLSYEPEIAAEQKPEKPSENQLKRAETYITQARKQQAEEKE